MKRHIIHDSQPIALVGAGCFRSGDLQVMREFSRKIVAADGGADRLLPEGIVPDLVVGDFDSVDAETLAAIPADRLHPSDDQITTDFEKGLSAIDAPLVLACGFTGGRFDHTLAVMSGLRRFRHKHCIVIGREDVTFLSPPTLHLDLPVESRFSIFPLAQVTGQSQGLFWPINGLALTPGGRIGTSNEVTGPVRLTFDQSNALIILPRAALAQSVDALLSAPARWPVHAG